jgi:MFS superfamily sulfate permease-like transporter
VDFLSRSTITGFMGGTAMIIIMQQLKGLLGMKHFTPKTDVISVVGSVFHYRHEVSLLIFSYRHLYVRTFLLRRRTRSSPLDPIFPPLLSGRSRGFVRL